MNTGIEKLKEFFAAGSKEDERFNIGLEVEHFVLNKENHKTMLFDGEQGIGSLMEEMASDYPEKHMEDGAVISLESDDILITLEPGCQLEISTAPFSSIDKIMHLYHEAKEQIEKRLAPMGYFLSTEGYLPYGKAEDILLIAKERYHCMDAYFKNSGIYGKNMMRATAACHVSIDYFDEEDFADKYRLAWLLNPIFAFLTENVTRFEDVPFKGHLLRDTIWQGVDNVRTSICPDLFEESFGFESYARWLMTIPVIVVNEGDTYKYEPEKTIEECFEEYGDSETLLRHYLSMAFPDVRLKQFIEIRSADSMPEEYVQAYCCLVKGLFCNQETVSNVLSLLPQDIQAINQAKENLKKDGFQASVYGQNIRLMLLWLLRESAANLPDDEKAALALWEPLIDNEMSIQGAIQK